MGGLQSREGGTAPAWVSKMGAHYTPNVFAERRTPGSARCRQNFRLGEGGNRAAWNASTDKHFMAFYGARSSTIILAFKRGSSRRSIPTSAQGKAFELRPDDILAGPDKVGAGTRCGPASPLRGRESLCLLTAGKFFHSTPFHRWPRNPNHEAGRRRLGARFEHRVRADQSEAQRFAVLSKIVGHRPLLSCSFLAPWPCTSVCFAIRS